VGKTDRIKGNSDQSVSFPYYYIEKNCDAINIGLFLKFKFFPMNKYKSYIEVASAPHLQRIVSI